MGEFGSTPWIPAQIGGYNPRDPQSEPARVRAAAVALTLIALAVLSPMASAPTGGAARTTAALCVDDPAFRLLDFWVGDWSVYVDAQHAGQLYVARIGAGCALLARWERPPRAETTLVYFADPDRVWKRVSISADGGRRRPTREQVLRASTAGEAVRFVGRGERGELHRTTLTRQNDGRLRHVEESSMDGGRTWTVTFQAVLVRA